MILHCQYNKWCVSKRVISIELDFVQLFLIIFFCLFIILNSLFFIFNCSNLCFCLIFVLFENFVLLKTFLFVVKMKVSEKSIPNSILKITKFLEFYQKSSIFIFHEKHKFFQIRELSNFEKDDVSNKFCRKQNKRSKKWKKHTFFTQTKQKCKSTTATSHVNSHINHKIFVTKTNTAYLTQ